MSRSAPTAHALVFVALLSLCTPAPAPAADVLEGRVVSIQDGDTLEVLVGETPRRIRIAGIDTPERGQPWARRSKQALAARVFGKEVRVIAITTDRYGRTVGEVYADDVCVGCELVRDGQAWVYRGFTDDAVLFRLEAEARAEERGLWALPESQRVPPWEWRDAHRPRAREPRAARPARSHRCGAKRFCREMADCAEARFHLEACGVTRLDGDGDGVPCESLCR